MTNEIPGSGDQAAADRTDMTSSLRLLARMIAMDLLQKRALHRQEEASPINNNEPEARR